MEFWAAIIGAIIGGFIALTAQLISSHRQLMERAQDRRRDSRQLGYALLFKVQQTVSGLENMSRHIDSHYAESQTCTVGDLLAKHHVISDPLDFAANELALLATWDENALIFTLQELCSKYRTTIELINLYNLERAALAHLLPPFVLFSKDGSTLTSKQRLALAQQILSLDSTLDAINRRLPATLALSKTCQAAVEVAVERKLQIKLEDRERRLKIKRVRRTRPLAPQSLP